MTGDQIDQGKMFEVDEEFSQKIGERAQLVGDDHRHFQDGELEGHRAGGGNHRITGGHHVVPVFGEHSDIDFPGNFRESGLPQITGVDGRGLGDEEDQASRC